jgi:transposase
MHLKTITELLNLPKYKVKKVIDITDESLHLEVTPKEKEPPVCSACLKVHNTKTHSRQEVVVEDMWMCDRKVFLHIIKRKSICIEDETIRTEHIPDLLGRNTKRFSEHVYRLTSITTNKEAGWFLGIDDERVYRIDKTMLEQLAKERLDPVPVPKHMSVDEVSWQKWHRYVTNVVDTDSRMVIWNHQGRGKAVLDKFYHKLGKDNRKEIKAVASDGARGFLKSTREHTDALIVLDHFHVKMYLNNALDAVRKEELKKARKQENSELEGILHCNQRFIMMKNKPSKKKENILETLSRLNQRVYEAMLLKDQFIEVYNAQNKKAASVLLGKWIVSAIKSGIKPFVQLADKFFRKRHYILNIFEHRISTAISEGINNKIKRLKRMAYGYRDVHYFLLKIHQHCGLLNPKLST